MAKFLILEPNEPPLTGYSQVDAAASYDKAVELAKKAAQEQGDGGIAYVEEAGTNRTASVQFHPGQPVFEGLDAGHKAVLRWDTEFLVTVDPTFMEVERNDEGDIVSETWSHSITQDGAAR